MKLTDTQIQDLYTFTKKHYVEHFDVQTELVDHLANDIEALWERNPELSFETARDTSFSKFGVFGFMDVVEEKQKQIGKRYRKILWTMFIEWFKLPKIILTFSAILCFYYLFKIPVVGEYIFYAIQLVFGVLFYIRFKNLIKIHEKRVKDTGKNWLLEDMIFKIAGSNSFVFFTNFFHVYLLQKQIHKPYMLLLFSVLTVITMLTCYIVLELIPNKVEELLEESYPEYNLV